MARLAAIGLGEASWPLEPMAPMAHPGGFSMVAVVAWPSHCASGARLSEVCRNQVLPALLRGGINVAPGNTSLTNGSMTTVMLVTLLPSASVTSSGGRLGMGVVPVVGSSGLIGCMKAMPVI